MEEKVLIHSEKYGDKKFFIKLLIGLMVIGAIISALVFNAIFVTRPTFENGRVNYEWYEECRQTYLSHQGRNFKHHHCHECEIIKRCPTKESFSLYTRVRDTFYGAYYTDLYYAVIPFGSLTLIGLLAYFWLRSQELTVTDKRIYGKAAFGKRVDLPMDSVSAVGTSFLKGVDVGTSSGKIKFKLVKNQADVHSVISKLLLERQKTETSKSVVENVSLSNADELKKYKDLLDMGAITQEEFDAKKKQLLGL